MAIKKVQKMESHSFSVILIPELEGGFTVSVPSLPEAITYGKTIEEALMYARECIELCIEMRIQEGIEIPKEIGPLSTSIVVTSSSLYAQTV